MKLELKDVTDKISAKKMKKITRDAERMKGRGVIF